MSHLPKTPGTCHVQARVFLSEKSNESSIPVSGSSEQKKEHVYVKTYMVSLEMIHYDDK